MLPTTGCLTAPSRNYYVGVYLPMKIAITIVAILIGLLSIAAGAAKLALVPEEVAFLGQFGFGTVLIVLFGVIQVLGGLLLIVPKSRLYGALVVAFAFALSAVLLLLAGNASFAGVSLVPVILAGFVAYRSLPARAANATREENI